MCVYLHVCVRVYICIYIYLCHVCICIYFKVIVIPGNIQRDQAQPPAAADNHLVHSHL